MGNRGELGGPLDGGLPGGVEREPEKGKANHVWRGRLRLDLGRVIRPRTTSRR